MLDAQPCSTPHTEPRVKAFSGQLSGYFDLAGPSGSMRPAALFGQYFSVLLTTTLRFVSVMVIWAKPGSPEKSFTSPAGRALVLVLPPPSWMTCSATTGSLYDLRVTFSSKGPPSDVR